MRFRKIRDVIKAFWWMTWPTMDADAIGVKNIVFTGQARRFCCRTLGAPHYYDLSRGSCLWRSMVFKYIPFIFAFVFSIAKGAVRRVAEIEGLPSISNSWYRTCTLRKNHSVFVEKRSIERFLLHRVSDLLACGTNQKRLFLCPGLEQGSFIKV